MLVWAFTILVLFLLPVPAVSQGPQLVDQAEVVRGEQADVVRAITLGQGNKALLFYENRAIELVNLANSSEFPHRYLASATMAYRLASLSARYLGKHEKAILYANLMLALTDKLGNLDLKLLALNSLYTAHQHTRNFTKAAEFLELGFKAGEDLPADSLGRIWWESNLYKHRGDDLRQQQEYERATEAYQRAINLKEEYLSRFSEVGHRTKNRLEVARTLTMHAYLGLGRSYFSLGKMDLALEVFRRGLVATEEWELESPKANFYHGVGDVLRRTKDIAGALTNFRKALDTARREQRPDIISAGATRIGNVLRETGRVSEAITFYREAIQQIESVRSLLTTQTNRQSYFGGGLAAYWGIIEGLWDSAAHDQAFDYSERVRSRTFLDMLGTKVELSKTRSGADEQHLAMAEIGASLRPVELGAYFAQHTDPVETATWNAKETEKSYQALRERIRVENPEQATLMSVEPLTQTQVQALLEPQQALLEYLVTPQRIYLWVVDKQQVHAVAIPISRRQLAAKVHSLRDSLSNLKPLKEYQAIAGDLYEQLIAPARSLARGKELIIVPHDVLHYLPFQALYSPQGKYLVEDHALTYLSSASLVQFTKAKRKPVGQKVLAVGNPSFDTSKVNLPSAELEANEIRRLYPRSVMFAKSEASEQKVKALAPNHDVLHFATHAELNRDDPLASAVLLAKGGNEDGRLEVREIFAMDLKASLVVLSGCETGLGQHSNGDELVGLTRAFIYAGTPSVVASLWKVDDASTAYLMRSFYRNLRTKTKVESLRQAQLEMIRGKVNTKLLAQRGVGGVGKIGQSSATQSLSRDPVSVSHPYFWAPFVLVGDGK